MATIEDLGEFSSENKSPTDIMKELFNGENPFEKTELSKRQVMLIFRLAYYFDEFELPEGFEHLKFYCRVAMSKDRASRKEFTAFGGLMEMLNKIGLGGGNMGGGQFGRGLP